MTDNAAVPCKVHRYGARFRRVRIETLDVVEEFDGTELGAALAMIRARQHADRKKADWSSADSAPLKPYMEVATTETIVGDRPSELLATLQASSRKRAHWLLEIDDEAERGRVHRMGRKLHKHKDNLILMSWIVRLMRIAGVTEIKLPNEAFSEEDGLHLVKCY